jgi:hypothetical protein
MKCAYCDHTERSPGGIVNLAAYAGSTGGEWVCEAHLPPDWMGKPGSRLHPHELFAIHAYVEKHKEALSQQVKAPRPSSD